MYTHSEIESLLQVGIKMLKAINIPVSDKINPRMEFPKAHSFYGQCRGSVTRGFTVRFSEFALGNSQKSVMNTILHELLHTCPDCMNHGRLWRSYAAKVKEVYDYDIQRCDGDTTEQDKQNLAASKVDRGLSRGHAVQCTCCGHTWYKTRESNVTLHPERYHCRCGGSIVRLY